MAVNITVIWKRIVSYLMSEQKREKTRDLHIYDYLEILQVEYVSAELRSKIYPKAKDKAYYRERVMVGKKEKIFDICSPERNPGLPNIFTNEDEKARIYNLVYNDWGLPNFHYRNDEHEEMFAHQDFENYYMSNSKIRIKQENGEVNVGTLVKVDKKNDIAVIKERGQEKCRQISLKHIARIL